MNQVFGMNLQISKNADVNYLCKLIKIDNFTKHPNENVKKLKLCNVDGFNVIIGIDSEPGWYIYFPALSEINPDLLSYLNLYEKCELNNDTSKKGFFAKNGRVRAIKLQGVVSEGFIISFNDLDKWIYKLTKQHLSEPNENIEFNEIVHKDNCIWINRKFTVHVNSKTISNKESKNNKKLKQFDKLIEGQFRFHYDTLLLKKDPNVIHPNDLISITEKIHGTSTIHSYIQCYKPLSFKEKIIYTLTRIPVYNGYKKIEYDYVYASRKIIKNNLINPKANQSYYDYDIWGRADEYIKPHLAKGMTIYAEIVGYLPNGQYIQKGYDYGCRVPRAEDDYKPEVNFKVRVYRITITNPDGKVFEFSAKQVQLWCINKGLIPVKQLYYGYAKDLYPDLNIDESWSISFLQRLENDSNLYMEQNSPSCINKVPHEGIVIRVEDTNSAFKLKCFKFINREQESLDKNIIDIEDVS